MRVIVFFDLPTITNTDKRNYRNFRKNLIKNGFYMMQESVYCRMLISPSAAHSVIEILKKFKPPKGTVQVLTITEKQFAEMEYIVGDDKHEVIDSSQGLVIL